MNRLSNLLLTARFLMQNYFLLLMSNFSLLIHKVPHSVLNI